MSQQRKPRAFSSEIAKRGKSPLLISLIGPSGSGKTFSALRLATGIAAERGGEIFGIDTESGRMKHYADKFKFRHVAFDPPFGPLDYLDAIRHCVAKGASVIVIDSMSHEHDGKGGVLERRDEEWIRLGKEEKNSFTSWVKPKQERNQLIQHIVGLNLAFVFCFRAKDKIRPVKGKQPEKLGLQPIAGKDFLFEMMLQALLPTGCDGRPLWFPDEPAAAALIKVPSQFRDLLTKGKHQLSEEIGAAMAKWSGGGAAPGEIASTPIDQAIMQLETCMDAGELEGIRSAMIPIFRAASPDDKRRMSAAMEAARERCARTAETFAAAQPPAANTVPRHQEDEDVEDNAPGDA